MKPTDTNPAKHCNPDLLRRSLICGASRTGTNIGRGNKTDKPLSTQEEEALAAHLEQCASCREHLESLAADGDHWSAISKTLLQESSSEHPRVSSTIRPALSSVDDDADLLESSLLKPSDFIVEFLQPSEQPDSLGRLGTIEIRQFIGQGAHGIVLKGYQPELNRLVAVKVLAPHLASVVAARKRFAREAKAAAAIVHPSVMPILAVDSSGPLPFLVMPYVDCESLQDRLDREGPLPLADLLRITIQVAHGLAAAHSQGLVHRDVKPANILLERGVERVMLTDFGLARTVDDATLTRSGLIAGTPHYMSPEQARGDLVDARSDLFSLGSVLYCMITGRPPFRAETTFGILRRVTDDEPRPLRELQADAPAWLETLTGRLLRKPVQERYESADQLAAILEECLAHVQQPSTGPLPRSLSSTQTDTARQRSRRLVAGSILASLMALGFGLVVGPEYFGTPQAPADQEPQPSPAMTSKTSPTAEPEEDAEVAKTTADVPVDIPADIDIEASLQQTNAEFDAMEQALDSEFATP